MPDTGNGLYSRCDNGAADVTFVSFKFERNASLATEMRVYDDIILDRQMSMGGPEGDAVLS